MWKKTSFSRLEKSLILIISPLLVISKKCASYFRKEHANKNKKTVKSNLFLFRKELLEYLCKSDIFAWRVT